MSKIIKIISYISVGWYAINLAFMFFDKNMSLNRLLYLSFYNKLALIVYVGSTLMYASINNKSIDWDEVIFLFMIAIAVVISIIASRNPLIGE